MSKQSRKSDFIHRPEYPGGSRALMEFIQKNIQYPEEALKNNIQGNVLTEIDIDYQGNVSAAKVLNGLGYGCDEEALRVCKLFKFSSPKNKGVRISVRKKITIHFRLPVSNDAKLQYTLKKEKIQKPEKPSGDTYSYTIQW